MKIIMIAPCGINCFACLKQFKLPVTCDGCNSDSKNKPEYCSTCIIKNCLKRIKSKHKYCFQCETFPCKRLKQLDRRYRKSYNISLIDNLLYIKGNGIRSHIENEKTKWRCPKCGNLLCIHRKHCLYCEQTNSNTKTMVVLNIHRELKQLGNKEYAARLQKYFKTGKGEYGEGDIFLGIRVPIIRKISKKYKNISINEASEFLKSQLHEERLFSLFVLVNLFKECTHTNKKKIFNLYMKNTKHINNWDLVDASAGHIVGAYLMNLDKKPIYKLAKSKNLWERRISIMSTSYLISQNKFDVTLNIAEILLNDKEDLIHKAVGWMLREIGNRNINEEETFLKKHYIKMPRTMLRYAIEKFPENKRKRYLGGLI